MSWTAAAALALMVSQRLPNGLEWAFNPRTQGPPTVEWTLSCGRGFSSDPQGGSGMAYFYSSTVQQGDVRSQVENLGGEFSVWSETEMTSFRVKGFSRDNEALLTALSRAVEQRFNQELLDRVRADLLESRTRLLRSSRAAADLVLDRLMSVGTPHARGAVGSAKEFGTIDLAGIIDWQNALKNAKGCRIAGEGRLSPESRAELEKQVVARFGNWTETRTSKSSGGSGVLSNGLNASGPRWISIPEARDVPWFEARWAWRSSGVRDRDVAALWIGQELIDRKLRAASLGAYGLEGRWVFVEGETYYLLSAVLEPKVAPAVMESLVKELNAFVKTLPSDEEFELARAEVRNRLIITSDQPGSWSREWLNRVKAPSPEDLDKLTPEWIRSALLRARLDTAPTASVLAGAEGGTGTTAKTEVKLKKFNLSDIF